MEETFDSAYKKIEEIVNQIQSWEIPLDQLVQKINEAKKLISHCEWILKDINKQVEEILPND